MTAVMKKLQDTRELKVHTAGDGDSLAQSLFVKKQRASKHANEWSQAIDRYAPARSPAFVREAW